MKNFDVLVVGNGSGGLIAESALEHELSVCLVDEGPPGGTCQNTGCIPSKTLIHPADLLMTCRALSRFGASPSPGVPGFPALVGRVRRERARDQQSQLQALRGTPGLHYVERPARFTGERRVRAGGEEIRADKVFVCAGSRPLVPPVDGLEDTDPLDNVSLLELDQLPAGIVIIGGGYVACEYGHFLAAMGVEVTILQRDDRLLPAEEPEVSALLLDRLGERMTVRLNTEAVRARRANGRCVVTGRAADTGTETDFAAERVLVAAGRTSNADRLDVAAAGIATDERGWVRVNEYLETGAPRTWAIGDIIGRQPFKHVANREALVAWHNAHSGHRIAMDYSAAPHAVYTWPPVARVGLTVAEAAPGRRLLVGRAGYDDVAMGDAMLERDAFALAVVDADDERILGFTICGPHAPILIQEVTQAMATDGHINSIRAGMHIHPALSEVVPAALSRLKPVAPQRREEL